LATAIAGAGIRRTLAGRGALMKYLQHLEGGDFVMSQGSERRRWAAGAVGALAVLLGATALGAHAYGQDTTVQELMRKVEARESENGFCSSVPWAMTDDAGEHRFLENAAVGSAEAARFSSGACSYTYVTEVYPGQYGKCLRYTWWACGPGKICAKGESAWCKNAQGSFDQQ